MTRLLQAAIMRFILSIDSLIVRAAELRVLPTKTYCVQNANNFPIRQHSRSRAGVLCIENQAAVGTGQLAQREDIPMSLEKPPHFRLFPAPTGTELFQGSEPRPRGRIERQARYMKTHC